MLVKMIFFNNSKLTHLANLVKRCITVKVMGKSERKRMRVIQMTFLKWSMSDT